MQWEGKIWEAATLKITDVTIDGKLNASVLGEVFQFSFHK